MKKRSLLLSLTFLLMSVTFSTLFTSCLDPDSAWPFSPPPGWGSNYFYDSRLEGSWVLTQANSTPVYRDDVNYMDFYGGGRGRYYYYSYGEPFSERMGYFCQRSDSEITNYQINIQYDSGEASTMAYWFTDSGRTLWLQWRDNHTGQIITYLYTRTNNVP